MAFQSKDELVLSQQLKVQELVIGFADAGLYIVDGSDVIVPIREDISKIVLVTFKDDSAATNAPIAAASLSIVDSSAFTAGGDRKAIKVASVTLEADDVLCLKYIVTE